MAFSLVSRRAFASAIAPPAILRSATRERPNIVWITSEDTGPHLGCYGDSYSTTPNLDRLAAEGCLYRYAWSNAPVCAPARTSIISGMYPPATGSEHMRCMIPLPQGMLTYPCYLRQAGYYVTNNDDEDYNLRLTGKVWDVAPKGHWRTRPAGQPFFATFNLSATHESRIRSRPHTWVHDPAKARVPAYHPDIPEVRQDWAQYYDNITVMDGRAGEILKQLQDDGLNENTIVFYYGDHGSGMPRNKRWPYDSGLHVPLVIRIPEKFRHLAAKDYQRGGASDRLVSFVDLAPTVLSLAGFRPPAHMQGHAFLGEFEGPQQDYLYGFRGRMDERYDMVRSVRDRRYVYLRQYMPHKIYGQHLSYMFQTPTTRRWRELYEEGKLNADQRRFWETKPAEELYDLQQDRDEVHNLASSPQYQDVLSRMQGAQQDLARRIRDVGFLPECEIYSRSQGTTPYEMGRDDRRYPMKRVMAAAEAASRGVAQPKALTDPDSAVRYWGAVGMRIRGETNGALREALGDKAPAVRIAAAEALGRYGTADDLKRSLTVLVDLADAKRNGATVSLMALNAIGALGEKAAPIRAELSKLDLKDPTVHDRFGGYREGGYAKHLLEHLAP